MVELHRWEDDGGRVPPHEWEERETRLRRAMREDVERFHASVSGGRAMPYEQMEGGDIVDDPRAKICLERHGFYMRPGPGGHYWIFVPVGRAPDGSPLTRTRLCFPEELRAWREGNFGFIARNLAAEGHPVRLDGPPRPGVFGRLLTALRRLSGG